jgi:hypothetical protein
MVNEERETGGHYKSPGQYAEGKAARQSPWKFDGQAGDSRPEGT